MCDLPLDLFFCDGVIYRLSSSSFAYTSSCQFQWQYQFHLCVYFWFSKDEGVDSWSDEDEDESIIKAVKCRWKRCGAVLQSKANGLRHMQVAHVLEEVGDSFAIVRGDWQWLIPSI